MSFENLGEIDLEARNPPGDQTIGAAHRRDHTKGGQGAKLRVVLVQEPGEGIASFCEKLFFFTSDHLHLLWRHRLKERR